jgi:hypothetical protein
MRWLFILVLGILVACVLSIVWMNDTRPLPPNNANLDGVQTPPVN